MEKTVDNQGDNFLNVIFFPSPVDFTAFSVKYVGWEMKIMLR